MTTPHSAINDRLPSWIKYWFGLDVIAALAPPLYLLAADPILKIWGLPGSLVYFVGVSTFIAASLVCAYRCETVQTARSPEFNANTGKQ